MVLANYDVSIDKNGAMIFQPANLDASRCCAPEETGSRVLDRSYLVKSDGKKYWNVTLWRCQRTILWIPSEITRRRRQNATRARGKKNTVSSRQAITERKKHTHVQQLGCVFVEINDTVHMYLIHNYYSIIKASIIRSLITFSTASKTTLNNRLTRLKFWSYPERVRKSIWDSKSVSRSASKATDANAMSRYRRPYSFS